MGCELESGIAGKFWSDLRIAPHQNTTKSRSFHACQLAKTSPVEGQRGVKDVAGDIEPVMLLPN